MTKVQAIAGMIGYELIDAQKSSITAADEAKRLKKKFTSDYMK